MSVKVTEKYSLRWVGPRHVFHLPAEFRTNSFIVMGPTLYARDSTEQGWRPSELSVRPPQRGMHPWEGERAHQVSPQQDWAGEASRHG